VHHERFPGRFVLGVGAGHPEHNTPFAKPHTALSSFLDGLDRGSVAAGERALAALGPRTVELARQRTAGAVPYLVTPEHTGRAREILGPQPLLTPEHKVVLEPDPDRARSVGRALIRPYLGLANYVANLRRLGFTDEDLAGDGSDGLVDALVAHGDAATVAGQLTKHLDAGADHVAVQVLGTARVSHPTVPGVEVQSYDDGTFEVYRQLARVLL
jgi:probable F420-dependent oxidoreductase